MGTHFLEATISFVNDQGVLFFQITLGDVQIDNLKLAGGDTGVPGPDPNRFPINAMEEVALGFARMKLTEWTINPNGSQGSKVEFSFDFSNMRGT